MRLTTLEPCYIEQFLVQENKADIFDKRFQVVWFVVDNIPNGKRFSGSLLSVK